MKDFCLKQGQGLMATAAHLFPKFRSVLPASPPPPPPPLSPLLPHPQPINATCKQWLRFSKSLLITTGQIN